MMTTESITKELNEMQDYIAALDYQDLKDMQILSEVLLSLAQKISRSASLVADATYLAAKARKQAYQNFTELSKIQETKFSPMILKDYISAQYAEELRCEVLAERVNRAVTHVADAVRSILSAAKTEFETLKYQP